MNQQTHHPILFETERLLCRQWQGADIESIYAIYSDEEGSRFVDDGSPITREETEQWMSVTQKNYQSRGYGMFALIEKSSHELIGCCGLVHPGNQDLPEIKYAFLKSHWGVGLASEVVPAMLIYGNEQHDLKTIVATVASEHAASIRVLEKSGLTYSDEYDEDGEKILVYKYSSGD